MLVLHLKKILNLSVELLDNFCTKKEKIRVRSFKEIKANLRILTKINFKRSRYFETLSNTQKIFN